MHTKLRAVGAPQDLIFSDEGGGEGGGEGAGEAAGAAPGPGPAASLYSFRAHEPVGRGGGVAGGGGGGGGGVPSLFAGPGRGVGARPAAEMDASLGPGAAVLLSGGADGAVKQWELFFDPPQPRDVLFLSGDGDGDSAGVVAAAPKLRHLPQLASQKLRRRFHAIPRAHGEVGGGGGGGGGGGEGAPAAVVAVSGDNARVVSASAETGSVRCWSRTSGGLLFEMSGFDEGLSRSVLRAPSRVPWQKAFPAAACV